MESGTIIIKTEINSSGIDKGIAAIEAKMEKLRKKAERPYELDGATVTGGWNLSAEEQQYYDRLNNSLTKLENKKRKMLDTETQMANAIRKQAYEESKVASNASKWAGDTLIMSNDVKYARKSAEELGEQSRKIDFSHINNSLSGIVKKVTKWGLAIFGVRSMYLGIRQAMNMITQYDTQLATDLQYIKYALAMTIKPIVEWLIKGVYTLMQYINYIWYRWFGKPLFANAGVEQFTKNLGGANKAAKELSKTIAGFDEMNVLNDNSSSDASAGIGGPSFDLSQIQDVERPWWVEWIADNKELILTLAGIIGTLFAANKIGKILGGIGAIMGVEGGTGLIGMLGTLGKIALIAGGIVVTGYIASKFLKDLKNLKKEIAGVNEAARKGVPEYVKQTSDLEQLERDLNVQRTAGYNILWKTNTTISNILGLTESYNDTLKTNVANAGVFLEKEMEIYNAGKLQTSEKQKLLNEITAEKKYIEQVIADLEYQGVETTELKKIQENYNQAIAQMVFDLGTNTPKAYDILREKMEGYLNSGMSKTEAIMATMRDLNNMKLNNKNMTIDINADTSQAERNTSNWIYNIKRLINNVLPGVGAAGVAISRMLTQGFAKGGIIYPHVPRLASGGIINMPGRGVPLANAYGGERGAEGVIPLTDSQQMMLLGEAIGKYVTINANIVNSMNGRVISRELQRVQNDSDFAYNR